MYFSENYIAHTMIFPQDLSPTWHNESECKWCHIRAKYLHERYTIKDSSKNGEAKTPETSHELKLRRASARDKKKTTVEVYHEEKIDIDQGP